MHAVPVSLATLVSPSAPPAMAAANDAAPQRVTAAPPPSARRPGTLRARVSGEPVEAPRHETAARPRSSFRGVAVRVAAGEEAPVFNLSLMHEDPRLSIPLSTGTDAEAMAREWQAWAKALELPLIAVEADGTVHAELTAFGGILAERPSARRKGSALGGRRSRYARRRRERTPVREAHARASYAGEREIIART